MSENIEPLKLPLHPIIRTRLITLMGKNETLQYEIEKLRAELQTARRDALKEAAQMASNRAAAWAEDAIGKFLETKWDYESRAEAGEEIASAILARAALGEKE
jgi:hypothetical protein